MQSAEASDGMRKNTGKESTAAPLQNDPDISGVFINLFILFLV